jgi:hypothetical protein
MSLEGKTEDKMKKIIIILLLILAVSFAFAGKVKALPELSNPDGIYTWENRLAITEGTTVYLYSLPDLKHIKTFGKKGEGPQEFKGRIDSIDMQTDVMVVSSRGKVSFYSKEGEFKKEINAGSRYSSRYTPLGKGFVGNSFAFDKIAYQTINLYDSALAKIKEIYRKKSDLQRTKGIKMFSTAYDFQTCDNKVFIAGFEDFTIAVADQEGNKLKPIKKDYQRLKFSEGHKQQVYEFLKLNPETKSRFEWFKNQLIFPSYLPAIRYIYADNHMLYIQTYRMDDEKTEFYIMDLSGEIVKKVFLPIINENIVETYPLSISGGNVYQVVENEVGEWDLHVIPVHKSTPANM